MLTQNLAYAEEQGSSDVRAAVEVGECAGVVRCSGGGEDGGKQGGVLEVDGEGVEVEGLGDLFVGCVLGRGGGGRWVGSEGGGGEGEEGEEAEEIEFHDCKYLGPVMMSWNG